MARVEVVVAQASDEEALLQFNRKQSSGSSIRLGLLRDPSYFASLCVEGNLNDVVFARDSLTGAIVGVGHRSERPYLYQGKKISIGYLSGLHLLPEYRNSTALYKAYRLLHDLHKKGNVPFYFTTIFSDNRHAQNMLTSQKAKLPVYQYVCDYHTLVVSPKFSLPLDSHYSLENLEETNREEVYQFYRGIANKQTFFPYYTPEDFLGRQGLLWGVKRSDFLILRKRKRIVGLAILWKQSAFRRWKVFAYSGITRYARPFYNILQSVRNQPVLPRAGRFLDYRFLSCLCFAEQDVVTFTQLLAYSLQLVREQEAQENLLLGISPTSDALQNTLEKIPAWRFLSKIYAVYWSATASNLQDFSFANPNLEAGSL
ncbi:MAG: hypothetical protein AAF518_00190 [Spirochaetota bacterium]